MVISDLFELLSDDVNSRDNVVVVKPICFYLFIFMHAFLGGHDCINIDKAYFYRDKD